MKKFVALFLSLVMMLSFFPGNGIFMTKANAVGSDDFTASIFWYDFNDAFLATVREALDYQLKDSGIYNYTHYDSRNDQANQIRQIDTAISRGTDLLIVNIVYPWDTDAAQAIVDKADAANIPVIFFNREVDDSVINSYDEACFVGVRAEEAGEKQGFMAGHYIVENYDVVDLNDDGKISYILMKGQLGSAEAEVRAYEAIRVANEILNESGKPELVYYDKNNPDKFQPTDWMKSKAFEQMTTALGTNPMNGNAPIEVVFANNDDAALGCIEALNNVGWNTGNGSFIPVFGIDYITDAAEAIAAGKMTGSILQSANGIAEAITTLAENVANGNHVFDGAKAMFNVDNYCAKIRVPFEIMTDGSIDYPDYPDYPDHSYDDFHASIFWYDFNDAFLATVREALDYQLKDRGIYNYTHYDARNDQANQNDQIDTAISRGTDLLIVNMVDPYNYNAARDIVDKADEANIPVIFFNREVDDEVINSYDEACYVGTRYEEAGEKQGIMAGHYIVDNYDAVDLNGDGKISYILMKGQNGNQEAETRTKYSVEFANAILEEAGKPSLSYYDADNEYKYQETDWMKHRAFEQMQNALGTNPMSGNAPIEVVFANNDDAAIGCINALNNIGWNTGDGNSIPVFGIDYTAEAAEAIAAGKMTGSILQSANGIAETITTLAENVAIGNNVFDGAEDMFNVDNRCAKIRVPYEIICDGYNDYPDYPDYPYGEFHASIFWYDYNDVYLSVIRDTLNYQLEDSGIYNYTSYDARNDQARQNDQIDTAIAQGTDLLIVNIVDTYNEAAQAIVDKADAANIPVIFFNREVDDEVINSYDEACFIGVRAAEAGEAQGIMAGEYIVDNYDSIDLNGDGKISYIMMKGQIGNAEAELRTSESVRFANYILEGAGYPSLSYYDADNEYKYQETDWMKHRAFEQMQNALGTNPMDGDNPIEVVFANNDDAAIGCIEALNNVDWNTGDGNSIPVFGIDYTDEAAAAINAGQMTGSVKQARESMAYAIMDLMYNVANGAHVFENAEYWYPVDEYSAKIRLPYEIIMGDYIGTPDIPDLNEGDVAVFWYDFADAFLTTARDALNDKFEEAGISYVNYDAKCIQTSQNMQIDYAIEQGASLLMVNIVDTASTDTAQAIVDRAKAADIPVIFFNREVDDEVINSYVEACYVGVNIAEAGQMQGQMAGQYIVDNYDAVDLNGDGKISYIMMKGQLGNHWAELRTNESIRVANEILIDSDKPELVYYDKNNSDKFQPTEWRKDWAFEQMSTALGTNPMNGNTPVEVVFANNDDAAIGCIEALNNVDWNTGYGKSIPVFGIDYTADAKAAMETGKMTGSILLDAEAMADTLTYLTKNVDSGKHVFEGTEDIYNIDEDTNKIRVPYQIMMADDLTSRIKGDVNNNFKVNNEDLVLVARYIVDLEDTLPNIDNGDMDGDGEATNADLVKIAKIIVSR